MAVYVVVSLLVAVLAAASVIVFIVGVLGVFGAPCLGRCAQCGHLTLAANRQAACVQCRYPHLTHPLASLGHHPTRVH